MVERVRVCLVRKWERGLMGGGFDRTGRRKDGALKRSQSTALCCCSKSQNMDSRSFRRSPEA